jgi:hypothetical protein
MPLTITIPGGELFDNDTLKFTDLPDTILVLEHSLISISKWEAIWKVPWYDEHRDKTNDELYSYIQCMTIKGNATDEVVHRITAQEYKKIMKYIDDPMTASTVKKRKKNNSSNSFLTSELIYAWMVSYQIPWESQKWHINRLLMLINILDEINASQDPKNKRSEAEIIQDYAKINERNKKLFNTKG